MTRKLRVVAAVATVFVLLASAAAAARGSGHGSGGGNAKARGGGVSCVQAVPAAYKASCGACHMAYPAVLLPEAAWRNVLGGLDDHFGSEAVLEAGSLEQVEAHLFPNAADRGGTRLGARIMSSLGGMIPDRISTLPLIQRIHWNVNAAAFSPQGSDGLRNCGGCHAGAEQGGFGKGGR